MYRVGVVGIVVGSLLLWHGPDSIAQDLQSFETEHFSISWSDDAQDRDAPDLTDADGDGIPDAVERMAAAFEAARSFLVDELGFMEPPGDDLYPVYIAAGADSGYTRAAPGGQGSSRPSFTVVPPQAVQGVSSDDSMRALAAHEYFHAIQNGYDASESYWFQEATATWAEDAFVDLSAAGTVRRFVPNPRLSLDETGNLREYGAFLLVQFVVERYGDEGEPRAIVREVWEELAVPEARPGAPDHEDVGGLEQVLARRGTSLASAWAEFMLWRRRIGHFEDGETYKEFLRGSGWRRVLRTTRVGLESCRLTSDAGESILPPLSGDYVRMTPAKLLEPGTRAIVTVQGPPGVGGFLVVRGADGVVEERTMTFDDLGVAREDIAFASGDVRDVVLGLTNGSPSERATIAYSLRTTDARRVIATPPSGPGQTTFGDPIRLSGHVQCRRKLAPFAQVRLMGTNSETGETRAFAGSTDDDGRWAITVDPHARSSYVVEVVDPLLSPAAANGKIVEVAVRVSIAVEPQVVTLGDAVEVTGDVAPLHAGIPIAIEIRRPERDWVVVGETTTDDAGSFRASIELPGAGIWELRARAPETGDDDHVPGLSLRELVRVRRGE